MMRIGLASVFLHEYSPLRTLELAAEAGYDCLELWADHLRLHTDSPAAIRTRAADLGLTLTLHAPHYDLNPLAFNPVIRESSQQELFQALELGAALGVELLVVHPGRLSTPWDTPEAGFEALFQFARTLGRRAQDLGLLACLELMEKTGKEFFLTPEHGRSLLQQRIPHIGLTVDIAHLHTLGAPGGAAGLMKTFTSGSISHVHLSDSGPQATHLPLGLGEVDIAGALAALPADYAGIVTIEGHVPGRGKEIIVKNREYLNRLLFGGNNNEA